MLKYLLSYLFFSRVFASITILDKGVYPLVPNSVGIQFFINLENSDQVAVCTIQSVIKKCCLRDWKADDCEKMNVHGTTFAVVDPKDKETLIHVYPTIVQHDQVGYCNFLLEYRCSPRRRKSKQVVNIPFDTRLFNGDETDVPLLEDYVKYKGLVPIECDSLDQDSLKDCAPVDCDLKYLGHRPYFDPKTYECAVAPTCILNEEKELPDIVYNPTSNTCRDLDNPLSIKDIYEIGAGHYVKLNKPRVKDELVIEVNSNCSTISQNLNLIKDIMFGKLYPYNGDTSQISASCKAAVASILLTIVALCALVLAFVLCLRGLVYFSHKSRAELLEKWNSAKEKVGTSKRTRSMEANASDPVDVSVKNALIRELMARDWPPGSDVNVPVNICERMSRDLKSKKRYRGSDIGSQISLKGAEEDTSEMSSSGDD